MFKIATLNSTDNGSDLCSPNLAVKLLFKTTTCNKTNNNYLLIIFRCNNTEDIQVVFSLNVITKYTPITFKNMVSLKKIM